MIRKLLVVAAAAAIPLGAVALGAAPASAAKPPPPPSPPLNCSASGTVTFASPGISNYGSASASKVSVTTTSPITYAGANCGTGGSGPANNISSKSTLKCNKKVPGQDVNGATRPDCVPHDYVYDSAGQFESAGVATIQKALKKLSFTVNGITFAAKTKSAGVSQSGQCSGEIGFVISGTVKAKPFTYSSFTLVACLGADSGPGTTGSFFSDILTAISGPTPPVTITSATIDGSAGESTLSIS
jgi:hypothetical protein